MERQAVEIVREVKRNVRIPVAVKLAPLLTAFAHFAKQLDDAGADGLVLFTRFHRIDIDVDELEVDSHAAAVGLLGAAAAAPRRSGAGRPRQGIYRDHRRHPYRARRRQGHHGGRSCDADGFGPASSRPRAPAQVRTGVEAWMQEHEWSSLDEMRGNMSLERIPDPAAYERANFRMSLR